MSTMKIYEQHKEWAVKVAVGIAAMILFYAVLVAPVFQNVVDMRQGVLDAKKRTDLYRELESLRKNIHEKEASLASVTERSQILGRVSDMSEKAQVHITALTPRTEPSEAYVRLRMEMEGRGSFFSLLKLMQGVERASTSLRIKDVSTLVPPSASALEGQNALQLHLGFETLLKQNVKKK